MERDSNTFCGHFLVEGMHRHDGKEEAVTGTVTWRTHHGGDCDLGPGFRVGAGMLINGRLFEEYLPHGVVDLCEDVVNLLQDGDRDAQENLLQLVGWSGNREREHDVHCR